MSAISMPWIPILGYEGYYSVSHDGTVRSLDRVLTLPNGNTRQVKGKVLSNKINNDGYCFVTLSKDGVSRTKYIHILVAQAFIPNPDGLPEVNHLDGDKTHNTPDNLEWCTHQQNVQHCFDTGLCKNKGGNHYFAVGVIDNSIGQEFATIKEWCAYRGFNYNTGRNVLSGGNKSKVIDLSKIVLQKKDNSNAK